MVKVSCTPDSGRRRKRLSTESLRYFSPASFFRNTCAWSRFTTWIFSTSPFSTISCTVVQSLGSGASLLPSNRYQPMMNKPIRP